MSIAWNTSSGASTDPRYSPYAAHDDDAPASQLRGGGLPGLLQWFPEKPFDWLAQHSLDFWLTSEDLPLPENRIYYSGDRVMLDLTLTNMEGHRRLREKLRVLCGKLDVHPHLFERMLYLGQNVPIGGTAHQAGTLRFGSDPSESVLDLNCRAHEIDNLYVSRRFSVAFGGGLTWGAAAVRW